VTGRGASLNHGCCRASSAGTESSWAHHEHRDKQHQHQLSNMNNLKKSQPTLHSRKWHVCTSTYCCCAKHAAAVVALVGKKAHCTGVTQKPAENILLALFAINDDGTRNDTLILQCVAVKFCRSILFNLAPRMQQQFTSDKAANAQRRLQKVDIQSCNPPRASMYFMYFMQSDN